MKLGELEVGVGGDGRGIDVKVQVQTVGIAWAAGEAVSGELVEARCGSRG